jgi:esterase/lipase
MENPNLRNPHLNGEPFFWQAGPVGVLLLHGFTATPVEVRAAADKLSSLGYSVAGPLLPGHATRPADLNRVRWRDWVDAAELAYRDLRTNCARVFVGGESMGACTTLTFALNHPERVETLLLTAPAIGETMNTEAPRFVEMAGRIQALGLPAFLAAAREVWRNDFHWPEDVIEAVNANFASHQSAGLATVMRTAMMWVMPDMERLRALRCPACVIAWPDDALHPLALAERVAGLIPRARLEIVPPLPEVFHNPALVGSIYGRYLAQLQ